MARASDTRERLMEIAEAAILSKGFHATSIDEIITEAGITKSGFFYHFEGKAALAKALLARYLENEEKMLDDIFGRARDLSDDPLQAFLIGLKLLAEMLHELKGLHPGCLIGTYCYQARLFDHEVREMMRAGVLNWRARFAAMIEEVEAVYAPRDNVEREALADMVNAILEGGIVMSRALGEPRALGDQLMLFRSYVKLLYTPVASAA